MSNYTGNEFNEAELNSSWAKIFAQITPDTTVLDVGCSSGNFGQTLISKKNCKVVGIDIDKNDIELAKKKLTSTYLMDIEKDEFYFRYIHLFLFLLVLS